MSAEGQPASPARDDDSLEAGLLAALRRDGRASVRELAAMLGASRDVVSHRLRRLLDSGDVRVVAALDPKVVGHNLLVHSMLEIDGPVAPVAHEIVQLPDAVFVSMTSGALPLVVESRHLDTEALQSDLRFMRGLPNVRRVRVSTYVEVLKGFFVGAGSPGIRLDALDEALIEQLQRDGRTSYRTLGETVHLAPSSARARVQRMLKARVIEISALKSGGPSRSRFAIGIGLNVTGDITPVRGFLLESSAIEFAAVSHGHFDLIATAVGGTPASLLDVIETLRGIPQVTALETWMHFDLLKEDYAKTAAF